MIQKQALDCQRIIKEMIHYSWAGFSTPSPTYIWTKSNKDEIEKRYHEIEKADGKHFYIQMIQKKVLTTL